MLINDKALARLLKEAWRGSGYRVAEIDGLMYIAASTWALTINTEDISRKVIGLLAEHLGYLPDERPVLVRKNMENQMMMPEDLIKYFSDLGNGEWKGAWATKIIWDDDWRLFQSADHSIHGVDIALLDLLNHGGFRGQWVRHDGEVVNYVGDDAQTVYIMTMLRADNIQLDHIEQFDWRLDENGIARIIEKQAEAEQMSLDFESGTDNENGK